MKNKRPWRFSHSNGNLLSMLRDWLLLLWPKANWGLKGSVYSFISVYLNFLITFSGLFRTKMCVMLCNFWKIEFRVFQNWQTRVQKLKLRRTQAIRKWRNWGLWKSHSAPVWTFFDFFSSASNKILLEKFFECLLPEKGPIMLILSNFLHTAPGYNLS